MIESSGSKEFKRRPKIKLGFRIWRGSKPSRLSEFACTNLNSFSNACRLERNFKILTKTPVEKPKVTT